MHGHFRGKIDKDIKCPPKLVLYHSKGGGNFHGVDTNLTSSVLCGWILCAVHGTREVTLRSRLNWHYEFHWLTH